MQKFIYNESQKFTLCGYSNHSSYIIENFDTTIRGIIFESEKIIYIRLNNFAYDLLNEKKLHYQFNNNLDNCITHLKANYKDYKIYNSLTIKKLSYELQKEVLSC